MMYLIYNISAIKETVVNARSVRFEDWININYEILLLFKIVYH